MAWYSIKGVFCPLSTSSERPLRGGCNHMSSKVWDEIAYLFPNSNGCMRMPEQGVLMRTASGTGLLVFLFSFCKTTVLADNDRWIQG